MLDKTNQIILVTGATGQQGGATARHLLAHGWQVRALTRNPESNAAQALAQAGAQIVQGDIDDRAALDAAFQGVYGVFGVQSIQTVIEGGPAGEVRQGLQLADAAKAAGVQHFVYSSVTAAQRNTALPHFESKGIIERYLRVIGVPTTVLRPTVFMENFTLPHMGIQHGVYATAIAPDAQEFLIAADDIGAVAALVFDDPAQWIDQSLELAGDALTPAQTASAISRATGQTIQAKHIPIADFIRQNESYGRVLNFFNQHGYDADIPALRTIYPDLMDFDTWLARTGKAQFRILFNPSSGE